MTSAGLVPRFFESVCVELGVADCPPLHCCRRRVYVTALVWGFVTCSDTYETTVWNPPTICDALLGLHASPRTCVSGLACVVAPHAIGDACVVIWAALWMSRLK